MQFPSYIVQINPQTNEIVATYYNARQAQDLTGIDHSAISKCVKGKSYKTVGGFKWEKRERSAELPEPTIPRK